jgi:hypothetical protein
MIDPALIAAAVAEVEAEQQSQQKPLSSREYLPRLSLQSVMHLEQALQEARREGRSWQESRILHQLRVLGYRAVAEVEAVQPWQEPSSTIEYLEQALQRAKDDGQTGDEAWILDQLRLFRGDWDQQEWGYIDLQELRKSWDAVRHC